MADQRTALYARKLSRMVRCETVSQPNQTDKSKFYRFHELLRELFPHIFAVCEFEDFDGSILMRWKGRSDKTPVLLMNHHDVVEAPGKWSHDAFSGDIAEGKVWGRGTLDNKGGLFAMLQAADELAEAGFVPACDVYFESACTEECNGDGADTISRELERRGIRFSMVLDEGGMIMYEPIGGAKGEFAMVGLGEKGTADLKFIARSTGGHASTPGKNTPLVRLGKFMAAADRRRLFKVEVSPVICEMLTRLSESMHGPLKFVMSRAASFKPLLCAVMPSVSPTAGAMLKTTLAFTMASGSEGTNVLPQEAWVIGNMRFSHHQGRESSIEAVRKLAAKYDIETVVLDPGVESPVSDFRSDAFALVERAVGKAFPGVRTTPYIMTGASDSRFMARVSDNCLRFVPFRIDAQQLGSIHGIDENVNADTLAPAVDFYKYILNEV